MHFTCRKQKRIQGSQLHSVKVTMMWMSWSMSYVLSSGMINQVSVIGMLECVAVKMRRHEIEHMERVNMRNNKRSPHERWRWPQDSADVQTVLPIQVLPCNVIGSWDTSSSRNITFVLDNCHIIDGLFQSFYN